MRIERRRLYRCSWPIVQDPWVIVTHYQHFDYVRVVVRKQGPESWLDPNTTWSGKPFPMLTRALPSKKPMKNPAGFSSASELAIERWRADDHCFQVVMLLDQTTGDYRLPSCEECEQLMGIDKYYTLACVKEHFDSRATYVVRRQLIGNSFNCCVISFLLQQLLYNKGYLTGYPDYQLCVQVGVAEKPFVDVSNTDQVVYDDILAARQLVTECLRISEKGGSDVRLDLGIPYRPNAWPRAAARPYLWSWEVVHGYPWRESEDTHTSTNWNCWRLCPLSSGG